MKASLFALLALALTACTIPGREQATDVAEMTIIDNVTVLDGRGGQAQRDMRVTIANGRITGVSQATGATPSAATVIDGRGKFLLPGYIDMHAHLLFPRCVAGDGPPPFDRPLSERVLSRSLDYGITFLRSPGAPDGDGVRLRDDLNANRVRGPRATVSTETINDSALSDEALRSFARAALAHRPDYLKVYARMRPEQVALLVEEGRRAGVPVIGHLQRTSWREGIALGVNHLVHAVDWSAASLPATQQDSYRALVPSRPNFLARIDWLERFDPNSPEAHALITDLARSRVSVDLTLIAYAARFSAPDDPRFRRNPAHADFAELVSDWTNCNERMANWTPQDYARWQAAWPTMQRWVRRMHEGGVLLVTATDITNEWIAPGDGLHQEFELLAEAGLSPGTILRMTGANAAEALRRDDVGIIEPGRAADLVLLTANPLDDIRNTRRIAWVMQGGRTVSRGPPRRRR